MCENNNTQRWYALQVQPKRENMVSTLLRYKGYEEYLPTYKARKEPGARNRERLLFPGYVFCKLALTSSYGSDDGGKVVTTAGVVRLLGAGRTPIALEDSEIEAVKRSLEADYRAEPWPFLAAGDAVQVTGGALRGIRGTLVSTNGRDLLVLSIQLLQRSVAVTIDRRWVSAVGTPASAS